MRFIASLCFSALVLAGCKKTAQQSGAESNSGLTAKIDACGLVTKEEVATIQGTPIIAAAGNDVPDATFLTSQCYYTSSAPDMSVTIATTRHDPKRLSNLSPRDLWHDTFDKPNGKEDPDEEEKEGKGESAQEKEKERESRPTKINGVGDEAFWVGSKFGGVLYVLKKDLMLRISVGGPDDRETKLEKSKALARKALSRL